MRLFGIAIVAGALLTLVGCGPSGPKRAPLAPPTKPVQKLPADEAGSAVAETAAAETPAVETETQAVDAATPDAPAGPQLPRPSVFLKLLAQPAQDAMQNNMEAITSGAGDLLPSP